MERINYTADPFSGRRQAHSSPSLSYMWRERLHILLGKSSVDQSKSHSSAPCAALYNGFSLEQNSSDCQRRALPWGWRAGPTAGRGSPQLHLAALHTHKGRGGQLATEDLWEKCLPEEERFPWTQHTCVQHPLHSRECAGNTFNTCSTIVQKP